MRDEILAMYEGDERLQPLAILLAAAEQPDAHPGPEVQDALAKIQSFNDVAESATPHAEISHEIYPFSKIENAESLGIDEVVFPNHFFNWGHTVDNMPAHTLVVATEKGVCEVVKWAAKTGKKVRVAGFRHTWR